MRLDYYLKVSMVIKRRTVAKELASAGMVQLNGKVVKPNAEVHIGDFLRITIGSKIIEGKIVSLEPKDYFKGNMFINNDKED